MSSSSNLSDAFASILFQMQQAVLSSGPQPDDKKALGPMADAWRAARKELGLAGKWATLEETQKAVRTAVAGGGLGGTEVAPGFDPEQLLVDPASGVCGACGSFPLVRDENGACSVCGCS